MYTVAQYNEIDGITKSEIKVIKQYKNKQSALKKAKELQEQISKQVLGFSYFVFDHINNQAFKAI